MSHDLLFIDAQRHLSAEMAENLNRRQFNVRFADSGQTARMQIDARKPDIIVADPSLPDRDGTALLKTVKRENPTVPLVIATSLENMDSAMAVFGDEAVDYLHKPFKGIALDIALKRAQRQLQIDRKISRYAQRLEDLHYDHCLYQQLFDEVPCYISVQDPHFRLTATNRLFKRDFDGQVGDYCYKIYKHRDSPCPECPVAKTFDDGKRHQTEEVVTSRTGRQYNVLTLTAPLMDENGEVAQVMEMATNITPIRRLQDHLASLGLMLGSVSHGVKGMLTALDGSIYQLETGIAKKDPERIARSHDRIARTTEQIRKMVLEILYYAKSGGMQYEKTDVGKFSKTMADMVGPMATKRNIRFKTDIPSDLGTFEVDPNWFQQALVTILENAVDACAMNKNGADQQIDFAIQPEDEKILRFTVADNGIGMDGDSRRKMFTLFSSSKGANGTGLGLFIAQHIIQQHGGDIEVASEHGKGTRFLIRMPRHRKAQSRTVVDPLLNTLV